MQAAGELIAVTVEFGAGVEPRQDQFDTRQLLLLMNVNRHAPAIITDGHGTIFAQGHADLGRITLKRFIDAVIDNFLGEMVGTCGICIHPRPFFDRLQTFKDFNRICFVTLRHYLPLSTVSGHDLLLWE